MALGDACLARTPESRALRTKMEKKLRKNETRSEDTFFKPVFGAIIMGLQGHPYGC